MGFRYNFLTRAGKIAYRQFFPVPNVKSPYTVGEVKQFLAAKGIPVRFT